MKSVSALNTNTSRNFSDKPGYLLRLFGFEGIIWITSLLYLAFFVNPYETHFTLCPLSNAGFKFCPGCGLGNSIALLFSGNIVHSIETHFLGLPAVVIIVYRIFTMVRNNKKRNQTIN